MKVDHAAAVDESPGQEIKSQVAADTPALATTAMDTIVSAAMTIAMDHPKSPSRNRPVTVS